MNVNHISDPSQLKADFIQILQFFFPPAVIQKVQWKLSWTKFHWTQPYFHFIMYRLVTFKWWDCTWLNLNSLIIQFLEPGFSCKFLALHSLTRLKCIRNECNFCFRLINGRLYMYECKSPRHHHLSSRRKGKNHGKSSLRAWHVWIYFSSQGLKNKDLIEVLHLFNLVRLDKNLY